LAVGKAPFHASKREEIYKKLQQREYAWPDLKKHQNCISYDLQDLVGSLLVDEDNRPVPDQIVSHQFFKLHWVPERLSSSWTTNAPDFPNNTPPGAAEIAQGYSWSWHQACKRSGVGEYSPGCTFPVVGLGNIASIFKDIEKEIKAGRAPTVPIAPTTVYLPFISEQREKTLNRTRHVREAVDDVSSSQNSSRLAEISGNNADTITRMLPIRRAPSRRYKENVDPEVLQPIQSGSKPVAAVTNIKKRVTSRTQDEKPLIKTQVYLQSTLDSRPQVARERTQSSSQLPRQRSVRQKERALPVKEPRLLETDIKRNSQPQSQDGALEIVATNDPTRVLQRATRLRDQLLFALQCKSRPQRSDVQHQTLPFVSKWVDYAKKHGVGYVLSDGTIGCAFNATSRQSVMHVVVRNGYTYLDRNKEDPKPESRIPLQFFSVDESGGLHVSKPEGDLWKRNAVLWSKFGRYMCQTLTIGSERKPAIDNTAEGPIVRYYQRIGPVGIWGFSDGCLQVSCQFHR
jgi:myosin-1